MPALIASKRKHLRRGSAAVQRLAVLGLAAGLLAGCSFIGNFNSTDTYDLSAPGSVKSARSTGAQILVPEPVAVRALDTERIVVRPRPAEINYYPGAQWSDRLPRLVQSRLVETFENTGRVRAGRPGQGLLIDYQVVTDIRSFEYDATTKKAHIEIFAKLMNDHTGRVVASDVFRAQVDCRDDNAASIVAALNGALDTQLKAIVGWSLKRISG